MPHSSDSLHFSVSMRLGFGGCWWLLPQNILVVKSPPGGIPAPTALIFRCQLGFSELSRQGGALRLHC